MAIDEEAPDLPAVIEAGTARAVLAETADIGQILDIRDQAEALRGLAKKQRRGLEAQNKAAVLKIEAERRIGQLLAEMELDRGAVSRSQRATARTVKLAELEMTKSESHRYQRVAAIPQVVVDRYFAASRDAHQEITTAGLLRFAERHAERIGSEREPRGSRSVERSGPRQLKIDEAVDLLTRTVAGIARRWPPGEERLLAATLRDLADDFEVNE
jgi:hypothetical protein